MNEGIQNIDYPSVIFEENYSKHHLPRLTNSQPVRVNFSINLSSILAVDEPKQVSCAQNKKNFLWLCKFLTNI